MTTRLLATSSRATSLPARAAAASVLRRAGLALLVAAAVALPTPALAAKYTAGRKFGRGLAGMTCGVLELPGNMAQETKKRGPAWGFTLGFVEGLGRIVVRELVGVYEFVTFPIPAPAGYKPILKPEYPWGYFD